MKPVEEGGSRLAIVFNGSPLFTGGAGSGPSEIRRWIIENDWLEAVVALPDQLFYNTGISTYFWVLTNRESPERQGKIQLVDAREFFVKMRRSLGEKRNEISPEQIEEVTRLYGDFQESDKVKVFRNEQLGHQRITVERPLRLRYVVDGQTEERLAASKSFGRLAEEDQERLKEAVVELQGMSTTDPKEALAIVRRALDGGSAKENKTLLEAVSVRDPDAPIIENRGKPEPDPELRDSENVPLPRSPVKFEADCSARLETAPYLDAVDAYVKADVLPYVPGPSPPSPTAPARGGCCARRRARCLANRAAGRL